MMQQPTPQALATPGPEAKLPAHVAVSGIAALVNGHPITDSEVTLEFLADGGQPTLDELIDRELIDQAAKKAHVTVTAAEIDARLKEAKQQVMAQIWMRSPGLTWAQFLTSQGRTEYYVRQNIKTRLLLEKLVAKSMPPVSLAGKMHLYHILFLTIPMPGHPTPHSDSDALAQAERVRAMIESGKLTFQQAAKQYSEDTYTAQKGGDLGWVAPTDPYDPDFMKAAQALKEGEISQPVKSRYGYHLIYLARIGAHATPAEIKAATDADEQARVSQALQPYLEKLHNDAKIQNLLMPGVPLPNPTAGPAVTMSHPVNVPPIRRAAPTAPAKTTH